MEFPREALACKEDYIVCISRILNRNERCENYSVSILRNKNSFMQQLKPEFL